MAYQKDKFNELKPLLKNNITNSITINKRGSQLLLTNFQF